MQEYFNKITVEKLRPNDFYNLGHILHNQVIRKNISTKFYERYFKEFNQRRTSSRVSDVEKHHIGKLEEKFKAKSADGDFNGDDWLNIKK